MTEFHYETMFPLPADEMPYRLVTTEGIALDRLAGRTVLTVEAELLTRLAAEAFRDSAHFLRPGHLKQLRKIIDDPEASVNDKFVAFEFLKNANIAAAGVLPMCQDTGTAIVIGWKGERVWSSNDDAEALSRGVFKTYTGTHLRYSQMAPIGMYEEVNTGSNLPAQIEIYSVAGEEYRFLFIAKGGGSANKTFLYQETPARLTPDRLVPFLDERIREIGTAACPPYHLAVVIGGTSAEQNLKTVKLASCRYLDRLPTKGSEHGHAYRDLELEEILFDCTRKNGIGAQFGGKYFCHDVRAIRLPRHGASLPIGIGVSCAADRQMLGKITGQGAFLEELETNPAQYMPEVPEMTLQGPVMELDLGRPMDEIRRRLSDHPVKTRLSLSGPMIVARDIAHARIQARIERGEAMPDYFRDHVIYYAGPAKRPEGYASGSFGPTTAGRMDSYIDAFQALGGSLVTLAKGNRSPDVAKACKKHGGFYLGSIGGQGARVGQDYIKKVEVLEYPELGMEAIWRIEVEDFPAFIVIDDKGNDFFARK